MPNQMRGQASAVYLFVINLIGLGLGPWVLPLLTDFLFEAEDQIHLSMLTTTVVAHVFAVALMWFGLSHFRRARKYRDQWLVDHGGAGS